MASKSQSNGSEFQSRSREEGELALNSACRMIQGRGFQVVEVKKKIKEIGVTVDIIANDSQGKPWYFDVSGSFSSERPGLIRTDTVWKSLGKVSLLTMHQYRPIIIVTTNVPKAKTAGDRALRSTGGKLFYDVIETNGDNARVRLRQYGQRGVDLLPLPGWWTVDEIYGPADSQNKTGMRPSRRLPIEKTGLPVIAPRKFPHRFVAYIPSKDKDGAPLDPGRRDQTLSTMRRILIQRHGGCTTSEANGFWMDPFGGVAEEPILVMESYSEQQFPADLLAQLANCVLSELNQSSVATVVDGEMWQWEKS